MRRRCREPPLSPRRYRQTDEVVFRRRPFAIVATRCRLGRTENPSLAAPRSEDDLLYLRRHQGRSTARRPARSPSDAEPTVFPAALSRSSAAPVGSDRSLPCHDGEKNAVTPRQRQSHRARSSEMGASVPLASHLCTHSPQATMIGR